MESALPGLVSKRERSEVITSMRSVTAFLMLGGGSMILLVVLSALMIRDIVMIPNVRSMLQLSGQLILPATILLSYSHFAWSYRFAYQQGAGFVKKYSWQLLGYPIVLMALLAVSATTWVTPVKQVPFLASADAQMRAVGVDPHLLAYDGIGQMIMSGLLVVYTFWSGQHFCMQAFGVALACGEERGYRLNLEQKKFLKLNMYALWFMNFLSGYRFISLLNDKRFGYHPFDFPEPLRWASCALFGVTIVLLFVEVVVPNYKQQKQMPPLMAALPIVAVWTWLQPFLQPYGFQLWIVPLAHGAQYLYFAFWVEENNFDATVSRLLGSNPLKRALFLMFVAAAAAFIGYLGFVYLPGLLDRANVLPGLKGNFFLLAAFVLISTHHYLLDSVVWRPDSRAKKALRPLPQ